MFRIIKVEAKRILDIRMLVLFLMVCIVLSGVSSFFAVKGYQIPDETGTAVTWQENLAHAKEASQGKSIGVEYLTEMRGRTEQPLYMDEQSLTEIVIWNYEGKTLQELSDEDISNFYARRLYNIRTMLEENGRISYTQEEKTRLMQKAENVSELSMEYAEGWKVLNRDMGSYVPILLVLIAIILMPLVGSDTKTNMKELYRSAKYGKRQLDHSRIVTAFLTGSFLYLVGIIIYFFIKILPFGMRGGTQLIQSNPETFFSVYNITNCQQFILNMFIGYVALLFTISLMLFIMAFMEKVMTGAVVFTFFWILLLVFNQLYLWEINHYFANFMPLRMTDFSHYYIGNEVYRVLGSSLPCMSWSVILAGGLAGGLILLAAVCMKVRRNRGIV